MVTQKLHAAIEKWIKVETWHTSHPLDDERFYQLLSIAESEGFDVASFIDVAMELGQRYYPTWQSSYLSDNVHDKASQAEAIMSYVAYRNRHATT